MVFIGQTNALLVELADIPSSEPGTMESGRKRPTAAAWRAAATVAVSTPVSVALPAPAPADRRIFLAGVRRLAGCMVLTTYDLDLSVRIGFANCVRFFNPLFFNIGGNDGS